MTAGPVIADTGALVALLDRSDQHHEWAVQCFKNLRPPLLTCESVLTEAWHLLGHAEISRRVLVEMCRAGVVKVAFDLNTELPRVLKLLEKYADTPMDFADACLVQFLESISEARVWTVDSDFVVYRRSNRRVIKTLAPWDQE